MANCLRKAPRGGLPVAAISRQPCRSTRTVWTPGSNRRRLRICFLATSQTGTELPTAGPTDAETEPWEWIVERLTKTYLEDWSLAALQREYSFVQGSWVPDFPTLLLAERTETREEIAIALADRAIVSADAIDPHTMTTFVDQALVLLADGQRTAAAALFDAARTIKPLDLHAQNNYAFCILPDKPDQAKVFVSRHPSSGRARPIGHMVQPSAGGFIARTNRCGTRGLRGGIRCCGRR